MIPKKYLAIFKTAAIHKLNMLKPLNMLKYDIMEILLNASSR